MAIWSSEIKELAKLYESLKGQLPDLEKELEQLIRTEDPNVIMLYSRRCLEVIITDLCECELKRPRKTEPLKGIIDKLHKEEKVPSHIVTSMHGLNDLSTYGTHPKDFDPEQVKPVLNNLDIISKWYLKYKETRSDIIIKLTEEVGQNINVTKEEKKSNIILRKRLIGLVSVMILLIMSVIAVLFFIPKLIQKTGKQTAGETIKKTIAVLPVLNFTGNPDLGWIADMIQSDLTGQLQGISNLIVRPRQTTLQFRKSEESVQQIAKKLSVTNLIESSIKGKEDNLQIEIRVIEAFPEERYLYRSSFSQSFEGMTNTYKEIINRILKGMEVKATEEEEKVLSVQRKVNPEVRKACARGLYNLNLLTNDGVEQGIKYYKEAIAIDPGDPEPYIELALAYGTAGHGAGILPDALQQSRAYALKAIELDPDELHPNIGDAHIVLAQKYFCYDYDFDKALYHLKRGLQLNPNSPLAHYLNGWYLALIYKVDEGADEMKEAIEIDPLNPQWPGNLAWLYEWTGRNEESLIYVENTIKVNPKFPMALYIKGMVLSSMGRHEEAIEIQKEANALQTRYMSGLGVAYALAGQRDKALEIASEMEKQNKRWFTWGLADIYAALGDNDKAMYWIEEAYRQRHDFIPWLRHNPLYKNLQNDPRFKDIINRLNLPE